MHRTKILLFANTDWYLFNFRLSLAERLRNDGWDVVLVSPPGGYGERLCAIGFRWIPIPFSTRSTNPLHEVLLILKLFKLYRQERPQIVHHFTIKCVLYGSIAARLSGGIKIVNAVTGLGHIFTDPGLKARLARPVVRMLYRFALGGSRGKVVFQNSDDRDRFIGWGLVEQARTRLIRGSGVNVEIFKPVESEGKCAEDGVGVVRLLFASRLLREKGVFELIEAFVIVHAKYPMVELHIAGDIYSENPSSLTRDNVEDIKKNEGIIVHGHVDDMKPLLADSDVVILPSYREGTPRILIEAAAMAKPIVATDIAGCRGLVVDGESGFLVPVKNSTQLAKAIQLLVADSGLRFMFGKRGRQIILAEFDESMVVDCTLAVYKEL